MSRPSETHAAETHAAETHAAETQARETHAAETQEPFFIGFLPAPRGLREFLAVVAAFFIGLAGGLGWLLAATQDDPGDGGFRWDLGRQTAEGVLTLEPYPVLTVTESARWPAGYQLLLSGPGKRGAQAQADGLDGELVTVSGIALTRGDLEMLRLRGGADGLAAVAGSGSVPAVPMPEPLGRWRITGEICDGFCYNGAMRPGQGLAHKACANLCLIGGVPPLFVATDEIEGTPFFLMADADGGPLPDSVLDHTAELVEIEGDVERRGDMLVFRIDPDSIRAVP